MCYSILYFTPSTEKNDSSVILRSLNPEGQHSFVKIDHEIFSTVILYLLLIQEGQLSVSGKRMHYTG